MAEDVRSPFPISSSIQSSIILEIFGEYKSTKFEKDKNFILTFKVYFIHLCILIKIYLPIQNLEKILFSRSSVNS